MLKQREDLLGTTSATSLVYASLDGWRRQMVEHGEELLGRVVRLARGARERLAGVDGIELLGQEIVDEGLAFELDPLVFTTDVRGLGITGYQFTELARSRHHVNLGASDACRVNARLTHSDDEETVALLVDTVEAIVKDHTEIAAPPPVDFPSAEGLQLDTVMLPRDAFFAEAENVPAAQAVGRIAAELVTPYPPGVPVIAPGELISQDAVDYLRSGLAAGMLLPDPADPKLEAIRVVRSPG